MKKKWVYLFFPIILSSFVHCVYDDDDEEKVINPQEENVVIQEQDFYSNKS